MANDDQTQDELRYQHIRGKATIAVLGNFILIFLHDEEVNPKKQILKFDVNAPLESDNGITLTSGESIVKNDINIFAAFNQQWFNITINNGFVFTKDDNTIVRTFADLDQPNAKTHPKMSVVRP